MVGRMFVTKMHCLQPSGLPKMHIVADIEAVSSTHVANVLGRALARAMPPCVKFMRTMSYDLE
jgi:hypothetical protein